MQLIFHSGLGIIKSRIPTCFLLRRERKRGEESQNELIHKALAVNQELMREKEQQWAQMKPFKCAVSSFKLWNTTAFLLYNLLIQLHHFYTSPIVPLIHEEFYLWRRLLIRQTGGLQLQRIEQAHGLSTYIKNDPRMEGAVAWLW